MYWRIAQGSNVSRYCLPDLSRRSSVVGKVGIQPFLSFGTASYQEQERRDLRSDPELASLIAKVCLLRNDGQVYESLLQDPDLKATQVTHELVDGLLQRFKDDWKSSLSIFMWAKSRGDYKPLPTFYDQVVDTLGKMKQMETMRVFVEEMKTDQVISVNTITKILRRLAGAGEWRAAISLFLELESFGLEKNTESMNLMLDTLCKEKKVEQAREIFFELKPQIPPDAKTFNIFIHGWCKMNRVDEAHWTIQEMKGYGFQPCAISYSTIIQSYCEQCNFGRVYELLDEMREEKCTPNVVTFTTIMSSLTKSGAFEEAIQISERMKLSGCKPDILFYNAFLHAKGRAGKVNEAVHVFEHEMPKTGINPNTSTYNTMIAMFCRNRQEERALKILSKLETSTYCKPDVQSYYPLLKSCFSTRSKCCLKELLDEMTNKHHLSFDLSTYSLLIHGLCKANKTQEAFDLFFEMIGQEITPRYQTCHLLLNEVKERGMHDAADFVENFMKKMTFYRSRRTR